MSNVKIKISNKSSISKTINMNKPFHKPLKDSYNRRIDYLRISVTDKCNLKCVYCMPPGGLKRYKDIDVMTNDEIVRLVSIAREFGVRKVRITGGEPLLRKDITTLISLIKKTGIMDLSLTTNGVMLSKYARALKKAGLDRVNVSLDTLDADKYKAITRGGDINAVWESIRDAERAGLLPIKINVVPIRGLNDDELLSFASLTFRKNYHIRFIEFMPANCNGLWSANKCVSSREIMEILSELGDIKPLRFRGKGPSRNYRINNSTGVIGIISPISDHFCRYCNRLRLMANGKIRPCLFSKDEIDVKTPMRNGASEQALEKLFLRAIRIKPEGHNLNDHSSSGTSRISMSKIGG